MQITPSGSNHHYKPGEDILLNCTFVFEHQFGSQLNWYTERNGHTEPCDFSGELNANFPNCVQTILPYDSDSCKWTNMLMIENFSKAAADKYICGYSTQFVEVTLDIEGKIQKWCTIFTGPHFPLGGLKRGLGTRLCSYVISLWTFIHMWEYTSSWLWVLKVQSRIYRYDSRHTLDLFTVTPCRA